jgi:hypothetical protein
MTIVSSEKSLTMTRKFTYAVLALVMLAACQKTDTAKSSMIWQLEIQMH